MHYFSPISCLLSLWIHWAKIILYMHFIGFTYSDSSNVWVSIRRRRFWAQTGIENRPLNARQLEMVGLKEIIYNVGQGWSKCTFHCNHLTAFGLANFSRSTWSTRFFELFCPPYDGRKEAENKHKTTTVQIVDTRWGGWSVFYVI